MSDSTLTILIIVGFGVIPMAGIIFLYYHTVRKNKQKVNEILAEGVMAEILFNDRVVLAGEHRMLKDFIIRARNYNYTIMSVSNGLPITIGRSLLVPQGDTKIQVEAHTIDNTNAAFDNRVYKGAIHANLRGGATYKAWLDENTPINYIQFSENR